MGEPNKWKIRIGVLITKLGNICVEPILRLLGKDPMEFWWWWDNGGSEKFWGKIRAFLKWLKTMFFAFLRHPLFVTIVGVFLTGIVSVVVWRLTDGFK